MVVQALRAQSELKAPQVQDLLKKRNVYLVLKTLFNLGIAISSEELVEKFKPRTETHIKLHDKYVDEDEQEKLFEELGRAPKQVELLLALTQLHRKTKFICKKDLLELSKSSATAIVIAADKVVRSKKRWNEIELAWVGDFNTRMMRTCEILGDKITKKHITYRKLFDEKQEFKRHPVIE